MAVAPCHTDEITSVKTSSRTLSRYKLLLPQKLYYLDSERKRKLHLASIHNESIYPGNVYHVDASEPVHLKNRTLDNGLHSKPIAPWTKLQFEMNDRWQLGADLPDLKNLSRNSGPGNFVPIPRVTYNFDSITITTLYIPLIQDFNLISTMGLYFIISF